MGESLSQIAEKLISTDKNVQLIYAFNGTGKTRLSIEIKRFFVDSIEEDDFLTRQKFIYYNAFTEDLFYWDNDLLNNQRPILRIQENSFTDWILVEQGQDKNIISHFQRYTNSKLMPRFNEEYFIDPNDPTSKVKSNSEVMFSFKRGNDEKDNFESIKISKGEESCFIWCIFYSLLYLIIDTLNTPDESNRDTDQFNKLEYIFIDDPVSSLDENYLIEIAVDIVQLIKSNQSSLKFIITTHNPLFYNILFNELKNAEKYILNKNEDGEYTLLKQKNDSPFAYHIHLKHEIELALDQDRLRKYHFNYLRNILEKTATYLGYDKWGDLLPKDPDGSNLTETRIINICSHSSCSTEESVNLTPQHKAIMINLLSILNETYKFKSKQ